MFLLEKVRKLDIV